MKILFCVLSLIVGAFAVSVETMDEQLYNPVMIGLRTRIQNDSNLTLRNVELRYVFRKEKEKIFVVDSGYKPNVKVSLRTLNDSVGYVSFFIDSVPKGIFPNTSGFSQGLHFFDWSVMDKKQNPSYKGSSVFVDNPNMLLYIENTLVSGDASLMPKTAVNFKIVGFQPEGNAWIDIQNVGLIGDSLKGVSLIGSDGTSHVLKSVYLDTMEIMRICRNDSACGQMKNRIVLPNFAWGRVGEALLKKDSLSLSYVPWGNVGKFVEQAVSSGVWSDSEDYFVSKLTESYYSIEYQKNVFYRIRGGKDGLSSEEWYSFTDRDNPALVTSIPKPIVLTMNKPVVHRMSASDSVEFSWLPVEGASRYKVVIRDEMNQVREIETSRTSVKMNMPDGNFSWIVYCNEYIDDKGFVIKINENGEPEVDYYNYFLVSNNVNVNIWNALPVNEIKSRKDTKLLNFEYGKYALEYGWDRPHLAEKINDYERNHCWLVAVQLMNHLYGGNITQDEIEFAVRFDEKEPLLSPFTAAGGESTDIEKGLKFALQTSRVTKYSGAPSYDYVKKEIDQNRPILVTVPYHAMVIYGYVGLKDNFAFLYAYRRDNEGTLSNSVFDDDSILNYYYVDASYNSVKMSDYRIYIDSDADGIVDFDEARFGTNPFDDDTDGDGIEDKRELFNSVKRGSYSKNDILLQDKIKSITKKIIEGSDRNKNDVRVEHDSDDDGDGIVDGLEGDGSALNMDVPLNYTLYARDHLVLNDGVKCYNTEIESKSFCKIGAAGKNIFSYNASPNVLTLGVKSHVGDADVYLKGYTDGKIWMRGASEIHGELNIFVKEPMDSALHKFYLEDQLVSKQKDAVIYGNVNLPLTTNQTWNDYLCELSSLDDVQYENNVTVKSGERFVLNNGAAYKSIKVLNGGVLLVAAGEMYVDSLLQVESNAKIEFVNPGEASVLHLNGNIIWRCHDDESLANTSYWVKIARGFKIVQHSSKKMYLGGSFGGTIYAPLSKLILGQEVKIIYGRFLAKDITVHQYSKVYRVDFDPIVSSSYVRR